MQKHRFQGPFREPAGYCLQRHERCNANALLIAGNAKRGAFYQAGELIGILEDASSLQGIRRIAARYRL